MALPKEAVISSRFMRVKKDIGQFFMEVVVPSGYTYFEWDNFVYKVSFDANNEARFDPTGAFYSNLKN